MSTSRAAASASVGIPTADGNAASDNDYTSFRAARAMLITFHSIAEANDDDERAQMLEAAATANGTNAAAVKTELAKFFQTLNYLRSAGQSARWTAADGGFRDVLDKTFAIRTFEIDESLKSRVRGKFKCTLCGQVEEQCGTAVHFAGVPTKTDVVNGLAPYSAKAFNTSDVDELVRAYTQYANAYNECIAYEKDAGAPTPHYLGLVLPGKTCLRRLLTAFTSQDLIRAAIDEVYEHKRTCGGFAFPYEALERSRVELLASKIDALFECIRSDARVDFKNTDEVFWMELLPRFADGCGIDVDFYGETDEFACLRAGYERMEHSIHKTLPPGRCVACDDENDEEDDELPRARPRRGGTKRKRTTITIDDEDDEDDEDEDEEEDDDDWLVPDDEEEEEEEPAEEETETAAQRRSRQRWARPPRRRRALCQTATARTRAVRAAAAAAAQRRTRTKAVVLADEENGAAEGTDPIFKALKNVNVNTARGLRTHPNNSIGTRRSTLAKLSAAATWLLTDGDLTTASRALRALSILTETLDAHEHSCRASAAERKDKLGTVTALCLGPLKDKLLKDGFRERARDVAEALIVAHEMLGDDGV